MQSVLVKQHVLDALSIIEKKQKAEEKEFKKKQRGHGQNRRSYSSSSDSSEEESSSSEEEEDSDDSEAELSDDDPKNKQHNRNKHTPGKEDYLKFDDYELEERKDKSLSNMDDSGNMAQNGVSNDDDELLLDNFFIKVNEGGDNPDQQDEINLIRAQKVSQISIMQMQEDFAIKKSMQEYELQVKKQEDEKKREQEKQALEAKRLQEKFEEEERIRQEKQREFQLIQTNKSKAAKIQEQQVKQEQAMQIIKSEMSTQKESLQERLKARKQNRQIKKNEDSGSNAGMLGFGNYKTNFSQSNQLNIQSPNLSNISPDQLTNLGQGQTSPINKQGSGNDLSNLSNDDLDDNMILKNLECDIDRDPDQQDEMGDDDDDTEMAEALAEIEKKKEEIMEEFYEVAFTKKHEAVEEVKVDCKKNKTPKDQEKKRVQETQQLMDQKRKNGVNEINKLINIIIQDENSSMNEKLARLQDMEQIRALMNSYFDKQEESIEEQKENQGVAE